MIDKFDGEFAFLSNFYEVDPPISIRYNIIDSNGVGTLTANTTEVLYQAGKSKNPSSYEGLTAGQAKRRGREEPMTEKEKVAWDSYKKRNLMKRLLRLKFDKDHPELQKKLLLTGDQELVEGNNWKDVYWGVYDGYGENNLGILLMDVRRNLRSHPENLNPEVSEWWKNYNLNLVNEIYKINPPDFETWFKENFEVSKKPRIYLSGPMTIDVKNFDDHFQKAEDYFTKLGWDVVNPAKDKSVDFPEDIRWTTEAWKEYIKRDIELVYGCDAICLLKGWEESKGAMIELITAYKCNLFVSFELEEDSYSVPKKINKVSTNIILDKGEDL